MENERIVYNPVGIGSGMPYGGYGGFGTGGGILEGLLFGALLGGNRRGGLFGGGDGAACCPDGATVTAQNVANLREQVSDTKADIIHDLQEVQADLQGKICDSEKASLAAMYEAKIAALQSTNEITNKISNESQAIEGKISSFQHAVDRQFCHVDGKIAASTQTILNQLAADKLDSKNDEIAELRRRNDHLTNVNLFSSQFAVINSAIADLSQHQKATNSTIQFGAGNLAGQAATANQVR